MASRFAHRLVTAARPAARVSTRSAGRRFASSGPGHAAKESSDTPWMIGSALVFGPVIAYLLFPSSKEKAKHTAAHPRAHDGLSHVPEPVAAKQPASEPKPEAPEPEDVQKSTAQAVASDSPKDAQNAEETGSDSASEDGKVHGSPAMTDSEGTTASAEEVDESMNKAFVRARCVLLFR
ncbi:uncharacterized protein BXZ73DRAFT_79268 [Epithele typhae]|uniref:uncharacterized protein n=1 Tax=Epithele typhae TaxID=378194 RepID=UPI002008127E|nr:uncharacterized protein BXZ73DRAFT_79268 [Epithele typhae]KAH9924298.1 hypothetical protein BXZ73DRAFT_79268 [Epithele typhae]